MALKKTKQVAEFGDFQTPDDLAAQVLSMVRQLGFSPTSIIEPSCGRGAFLYAAAAAFPQAKLIGVDLNEGYLAFARQRLPNHRSLILTHQSFFSYDWVAGIEALSEPILILGNPPWVTNAELGTLGSDNLPAKSNFQNMKGFDALTGKSNFDISEWMLLQNVNWLRIKNGSLAVLCKTAVARKILAHVWKSGIAIADARIYRIDALAWFGAAVDACLFVITIDGKTGCNECAIYPSLNSSAADSHMGFIDHTLIANVELYRKFQDLRGLSKTYTWRSGLKHDCSKVMELTRTPDGLMNGFGESVDIEETYLYPLIKSSDIAGVRQKVREKFVIVTQRKIGEETSSIARVAPRTWAYLQKHQAQLSGRSSVIYRNKPDFCVFGIGDYSFTPWKIAISGLYKKFVFRLYGNDIGKPIIFDDTAYFLPFETREHAQSVLEMLNSEAAQQFLAATVFWDEKRPITVELLKRLDIIKLATHLRRSQELDLDRSVGPRGRDSDLQHQLFA
jgi:hypothetical protein